jgi:hypothetical protein
LKETLAFTLTLGQIFLVFARELGKPLLRFIVPRYRRIDGRKIVDFLFDFGFV